MIQYGIAITGAKILLCVTPISPVVVFVPVRLATCVNFVYPVYFMLLNANPTIALSWRYFH